MIGQILSGGGRWGREVHIWMTTLVCAANNDADYAEKWLAL